MTAFADKVVEDPREDRQGALTAIVLEGYKEGVDSVGQGRAVDVGFDHHGCLLVVGWTCVCGERRR